MDANHDTPSMTQYGFEPFEAAIALMTTRYISEHVSKAELWRIINPKVIKLKDGEPVHTEIDAPKLAELLNDARDWYQTTGRGYDDELMADFNDAIDQLIADFDGMQYIQTKPVGFYRYLANLYIALPAAG